MACAGAATAGWQPHLPAGPVVHGRQTSILSAILRPDAALAVWERGNPCAAAAEPAEPIDIVLAAEAVATAIGPALAHGGYRRAVPTLSADIAMLTHHLADLAGASWLRIRLDRVADDACRRFHADYVTLRLLTTYAGPATEWQAAPDGPIRQLRAGDVAILKGRLLLDPPAILHRSPPIAGLGVERVLLAIDPAAGPASEQER